MRFCAAAAQGGAAGSGANPTAGGSDCVAADCVAPVDERIVRFIRRHHLLTLATASGGSSAGSCSASSEGSRSGETVDSGGCEVWCAHAFYAYDGRFVFSSGADTRHVAMMLARPRVALGVALESRVVGKLQGVQVCGLVREADAAARRTYLKRFPFAAAVSDLRLWMVEPASMKFTDNTLGFGKKLLWSSDLEVV